MTQRAGSGSGRRGKSPAAITAVTFDCWGTLIVDRGPDGPTAARLRSLIEHGADVQSAHELLQRAWEEHHRSWVSGVQYGAEGIAKYCANELGIDDHSAMQLAFEEAAREVGIDPLPGARETVEQLRAQGIRTALVCDTGYTPGRVVREFLDIAGIAQHLEFLAFSNEVGVPKPDPRIFRTALDAIGAQPEEAVHVGDLRRTDVAGAKALGMKAIQITMFEAHRVGAKSSDSTQGPEPDAIITSYDQFGAALASLQNA